MRALALLLLVIACAFTIGCGSIGEPLYPAINIPTPVADLTAVERGNRIDINFTIPALTTEGLVVKTIGAVELRIGPNQGPGFEADRWASTATRIDVPPPSGPGPFRVPPVPVPQFIGQDVIVGVRLANTKGRYSGWSNLITLKVEQPLAVPANVRAEAVPRGVSISWKAAGANQFRVYRKTGDDKMPSELPPSISRATSTPPPNMARPTSTPWKRFTTKP